MDVKSKNAELSFGLTWPPSSAFGAGAVETLGERAKAIGAKRVLLVTDEGLKAVGLADRVAGILRKSGVEVTIFPKVQPNPTMAEVEEGVALFKSGKHDFLVALGGGSSIDATKVISMQLLSGRSIEEIAARGVDDAPGEPVDFIAVPTTSGTGSEATTGALVKDASGRKYLVRSVRCRPAVALLDPELTLTVPRRMTAATGFDAFVHAVGSFTNAIVNPVADLCAKEAIRIVSRNLLRAVEHGDDLDARTAMMLGSHLAGVSIAMKGNDLVHGMSTAVESMINCTHGESLAIIWPHVLTFNQPATTTRYAEIAGLMGINVGEMDEDAAAKRAVNGMIALRDSLGLPRNLLGLGARRDMIPRLVELAASGRSTLINCRVPNNEQLEALFEAAIGADVTETNEAFAK